MKKDRDTLYFIQHFPDETAYRVKLYNKQLMNDLQPPHIHGLQDYWCPVLVKNNVHVIIRPVRVKRGGTNGTIGIYILIQVARYFCHDSSMGALTKISKSSIRKVALGRLT